MLDFSAQLGRFALLLLFDRGFVLIDCAGSGWLRLFDFDGVLGSDGVQGFGGLRLGGRFNVAMLLFGSGGFGVCLAVAPAPAATTSARLLHFFHNSRCGSGFDGRRFFSLFFDLEALIEVRGFFLDILFDCGFVTRRSGKVLNRHAGHIVAALDLAGSFNSAGCAKLRYFEIDSPGRMIGV